MAETVSVRTPDELKREIDEADINVNQVIRDALENEVTERRRETLRDDVGDTGKTDEIVSAVREAREDR